MLTLDWRHFQRCPTPFLSSFGVKIVIFSAPILLFVLDRRPATRPQAPTYLTTRLNYGILYALLTGNNSKKACIFVQVQQSSKLSLSNVHATGYGYPRTLCLKPSVAYGMIIPLSDLISCTYHLPQHQC